MKGKLLLELRKPYLTPIEADEIRAEIMAMKPKIALVMADWPWIEVRGLTELRAKALLESLEKRGVRFRVIGEKRREVVKV